MILFILSTWVSLILLIWFMSDAIIDWGTVFGLGNFLKVKEYKGLKLAQLPLDINYPSFLNMKYNNFLTKLLSCPLCLSIWLTPGFYVFTAIILLNPLLIVYIPASVIISLLFYGLTVKLIK